MQGVKWALVSIELSLSFDLNVMFETATGFGVEAKRTHSSHLPTLTGVL